MSSPPACLNQITHTSTSSFFLSSASPPNQTLLCTQTIPSARLFADVLLIEHLSAVFLHPYYLHGPQNRPFLKPLNRSYGPSTADQPAPHPEIATSRDHSAICMYRNSRALISYTNRCRVGSSDTRLSSSRSLDTACRISPSTTTPNGRSLVTDSLSSPPSLPMALLCTRHIVPASSQVLHLRRWLCRCWRMRMCNTSVSTAKAKIRPKC